MDELMARTMVETLAKGIDPVSGLALPDDHLCNNEEMQEALEIVLENCTIESYKDLLARKKAERAEARHKKRELAKRRNKAEGELSRIPINVAKAPPYKPSSSKSQYAARQLNNDHTTLNPATGLRAKRKNNVRRFQNEENHSFGFGGTAA